MDSPADPSAASTLEYFAAQSLNPRSRFFDAPSLELFQLRKKRNHLRARVLDGARAIDHFIRHPPLFVDGHLRRDPLPRLLDRQPPSNPLLCQTSNLLLRGTPSDHQAIQLLVKSSFNQQSGLHHRDGVRIASFDGGELANLLCKNWRVHNGVQTREALWISEHDGAKLRPVDEIIRREDAASKFANHCVVSFASGLDHPVRDLVRFEDVAAEFAKHRDHRGLPSGDPSGQADAQHQGLAAATPALRATASVGIAPALRRPAAFTVLLISMAIVSGPTPPGTGVIAPATSATAG